MKKFLIAFGAIFISIILLTGTFAAGLFAGTKLEIDKQADLGTDSPSLDKVGEVMHMIENSYVEPANKDKIVDGAINGMLKALDDPFTRYLNIKDAQHFKEDTSGKFEGVGMVVGADKDGRISVDSLLEGTPAEKAGIKAGDIILEIDGKTTKGMTIDSAVSKIKGKKGTTVKLALSRGGHKDPIRLSIVRAEINSPNVRAKVLDGKYGVIHIAQFNEQTNRDLEKSIAKVKSEGAKGIILDLRSNPGGLLDEAVDVTSKFIDTGAVVKIKSRDGEITPRLVRTDSVTDTKIPLVVLVDRGSASASEIVSGAIQDYHRGVLVGEKTFGKASVQTVLTLQDGSNLLLTTDHYLTPNGRMIHKKGIEPDVKVVMDEAAVKSGKDVQIEKAKAVLGELIDGKRKP